jgi:hypothetical protein
MKTGKTIAVLALSAATMFAVASSVAAPQAQAPVRGNTPMVQDWSTQHAVFRHPLTPDEARMGGRLDRWQRLAKDPRYMLGLLRRFEREAAAADARTLRPSAAKPGPGPGPVTPPETLHRDWSNVLGGGIDGLGGSGVVDVFPAKFSFDINAAPSCSNDFVVYGTNAAGQGQGGTQETWVASFSGDPAAAQTVRVGQTTSNSRTVTLVASATLNTGLNFQFTGNTTTNAINLKDAVNRWSGQTGIRASQSGAQVTITSNVGGDMTATTVVETLNNFGNFVNTNGTGTTYGQASIVAFNQLYSGAAPGCNATRNEANAPNVMWAYNTGGTVRTSPTLSYNDNGAQVAFIQSNASNVAELVLLRWKAGDGSVAAPANPALAANATDYRLGQNACALGVACMFKIPFAATVTVTPNTPDDLISSPFVDYASGTLYVGANNGTLHKFTNVFSTSANVAEVTSGGFPSVVSASNALSSPVYDFAGSVFLGSASAVGSGGALHKVNGSTGAVTSSVKLTADSINPGVRASPMMDVSAGHAYAFVFNDGSTVAGTNCTSFPCRAAVDFDRTTFPAINKRLIGSGNSTTRAQAYGAFDSNWFNSPTSDGYIYVCGGTPGDTTQSMLWKLPLTGGVLGDALPGPTVSGTASAACSPVSQVQNGANEYLYFSLASDGNLPSVCTGSCVYSYNLASLSSTPISEKWTFAIQGNQVAAGTITVNGIVFTANATQNCAAHQIDIGGNGSQDAARIVSCINSDVPGYTASVTPADFTITRTAAGNVADNNVVVGFDKTSENLNLHQQGCTTTEWCINSTPKAGINSPGGSGGMIIDNISSQTGASQVYFGQLLAPGNAIQVRQDTLN